MTNKYKNPWAKSCNTPRPEFYENNAPLVMNGYRGVSVYQLHSRGYDYVFQGCCITQRAGFNHDSAPKVIDEIMDGEQPVSTPVAKHLRRFGCSALTYDEYTQLWKKGLRQ